MKKVALALMMVVVLLASTLSVYAYGAHGDEVNKIPPCPHAMQHNIVVNQNTVGPNLCDEHTGCWKTIHTVTLRTVCMECGAPLSATWTETHITHDMEN